MIGQEFSGSGFFKHKRHGAKEVHTVEASTDACIIFSIIYEEKHPAEGTSGMKYMSVIQCVAWKIPAFIRMVAVQSTFLQILCQVWIYPGTILINYWSGNWVGSESQQSHNFHSDWNYQLRSQLAQGQQSCSSLTIIAAACYHKGQTMWYRAKMQMETPICPGRVCMPLPHCK